MGFMGIWHNITHHHATAVGPAGTLQFCAPKHRPRAFVVALQPYRGSGWHPVPVEALRAVVGASSPEQAMAIIRRGEQEVGDGEVHP